MPYTNLAATDRISDTRAVLNGVSTRTDTLDFVRHCDSAAGTAPVLVEDGLALIEEFALSDRVYCLWRIPPEIDRTVNATLTLDLCTRGAEASKNCSFDLAILSMNSSGNTAIGAATGTVQIVNSALPTSNDVIWKATVSVPVATYFTSATIEALSIRITRVAAAADPTAAVGVMGVAITFGVVR